MSNDASRHLNKRYLPNLTQHLACCSANYQRLCQLLPKEYQVGEKFTWTVRKSLNFELLIVEKQKYTETFDIHQVWLEEQVWLTNLVMKLRLYHDMNLAEVISLKVGVKEVSYQGIGSIKDYLTTAGEKTQSNNLLSEWLTLCLADTPS